MSWKLVLVVCDSCPQDPGGGLVVLYGGFRVQDWISAASNSPRRGCSRLESDRRLCLRFGSPRRALHILSIIPILSNYSPLSVS